GGCRVLCERIPTDERLPADECAAEREEPVVYISAAFVAPGEAAGAVEPGQRPLHHPATRPIGRLVSVTVSILSGGRFQWTRLSRDDDVRRHGRVAGTGVSAPAPADRPTRSTCAIRRSPSATVRGLAGSR